VITRFSSVDLSCTLPQAELEQIIVNLVNNAIHAIGIAPGEIEIVVDEAEPVDRPTTFADERGYARIVIRDSGSGMSESTRARLFEPFFTTKPQGQGTGLGLAVVHGVVRAAGGSIDVASEEGGGTTFTLWLPRAEPAPAAQPPSPNLPRSPGQGEHILYVDDDEAITFLVQRILEKSGYRVTCCDDPRDAYRAFVEQPHAFDVVVTDLTMPTMGGFELVRGLRAIRSDVPVIMMSGYVRDSDQTRANDEGIGRILLKPNTIEELGHELNLRCAQLRAARQVGP
jgi:CheY-like chemotaxis protein/anti-sigma regulatory factor (Ser/Thr protein kinase)